MSYSTFKIHNSGDSNRITKGIKIAQCTDVYTSEPLGLANDFPISPRDTVEGGKEALKEVVSEIPKGAVITDDNSQENNNKIESFAPKKRRNRTKRLHIDRPKPRKSPYRTLSDIVVRLAKSTPESESESREGNPTDRINPLIKQNVNVKISQPFQDGTTVIELGNRSNKRTNRRKPKKKRVKEETPITNEVLLDAKRRRKLRNAIDNQDYQESQTPGPSRTRAERRADAEQSRRRRTKKKKKKTQTKEEGQQRNRERLRNRMRKYEFALKNLREENNSKQKIYKPWKLRKRQKIHENKTKYAR